MPGSECRALHGRAGSTGRGEAGCAVIGPATKSLGACAYHAGIRFHTSASAWRRVLNLKYGS